MKINFIIPMTHHTGGIQVIFTYAEYFYRKGHDVVCYYPNIAYETNSFWSRFKSTVGNFVKDRKNISFMDISFMIKGIALINNYNIRNADVTIATSYQTAYDVEKLSLQKGQKFYFIQDYEIWFNKKKCEQSYYLNLKKIVIANWLNKLLVEHYDCPPSPVIYNGINLNEFYNEKKRNNADKVKNFLMLSNWRSSKNCEMGVQIFKYLKSKYPLSQFRMFGINYDDRIPSFVEFYENPTKDELRGLYNQSNIFLFPSSYEGWGLTVVEAMACGCVVVGCNVGFLKEFGIHRTNAMISQIENEKEMIKNIEELLQSTDLMNLISSNCQQVVKQFDWSQSTNKFLEILKNDK